MTIRANMLASGAGWQAYEFICSAGPSDRPFEEMHKGFSIAAVTSGTFQYRSSDGDAILGPGALLLGNHGACYQCGHEHGAGDRCLSFHYEPEFFETLLADVAGGGKTGFARTSLPPIEGSISLLAQFEAASDADEFETLAHDMAAMAVTASGDSGRRTVSTRSRDERRISDALRHIEAAADERLSLAMLADTVGMSRYHFLRTFRRIVGMTPHQYVLRMRMQRAAARIRQSEESISTIAFDSGFEDLSTFNRRFLQVVGDTPGGFRRRTTRRKAPAAPSPRPSSGAASARS
ncbi:MAG TPA: AraC family transcriptional regulator [Xanthobacteraceae bacterium]|nr:AraC family transcriptional regulator [Xanthobacteraceae bacterium]